MSGRGSRSLSSKRLKKTSMASPSRSCSRSNVCRPSNARRSSCTTSSASPSRKSPRLSIATPAACRQLAARARTHVRADRPRFDVPKERGIAIAEAFFNATRSGDMAALQSLLAADVTVYADGGGKRPAATYPVHGQERVLQFHTVLARFFAQGGSTVLRYTFINGLPGFLSVEPDGVIQTTALQVEHGKIAAVYVMRNPDKLRHLDAGTIH